MSAPGRQAHEHVSLRLMSELRKGFAAIRCPPSLVRRLRDGLLANPDSGVNTRQCYVSNRQPRHLQTRGRQMLTLVFASTHRQLRHLGPRSNDKHENQAVEAPRALCSLSGQGSIKVGQLHRDSTVHSSTCSICAMGSLRIVSSTHYAARYQRPYFVSPITGPIKCHPPRPTASTTTHPAALSPPAPWLGATSTASQNGLQVAQPPRGFTGPSAGNAA